MARDRLSSAQCRLIEEHYDYATALARKQQLRAPKHVDGEELLSRAYLGLVQAVQRWPDYCAENSYDQGHGEREGFLKAYVTRRVNGAILDYMREQDWAPRASRELIKRHDTGATTDAEIAERSGASLEQVRQARSDVESSPVSTEAMLSELPFATASVEDEISMSWLLGVFSQATRDLLPLQKAVFISRIYWQTDVKTTAENLNMTPSQVSACFNEACDHVVGLVMEELEVSRGGPGRMMSLLEAL